LLYFSLQLSEDDGEGKEEWIDKRKIDSISWLLYDKKQRSEAMYQANDLTRSLVESAKYDLAKEVWYDVIKLLILDTVILRSTFLFSVTFFIHKYLKKKWY